MVALGDRAVRAAYTSKQQTVQNLIYILVAHTICNALLLSPLNPLRCTYFSLTFCSRAENWMCNWLSLSHTNVAVLLGSTAYSSDANSEKLGSLCCVIILVFLIQGVFVLDLLDPLLAILQVVVYAAYIVVFLVVTHKSPNSIAALLHEQQQAALKVDKLKSKQVASTSSFAGRTKLPIATFCMMLILISTLVCIRDLTFGREKLTNSVIYKTMFHFAVSDLMLSVSLLIFSLQYGEKEQHKFVLAGQSFVLVVLQILLFTSQGQRLDNHMAASVGTFFSLAMSVVGAMLS